MLDFLIEQRLEDAVSRGEFQNLPGEGRPLELDDDALVPEDLRLAYRILKNAGFVPPEAKAVRKLSLLKARMERAYFKKAVARLGR
jgi:hypothetical protein